MDSEKLLWVTGVSHLKREKRKKSSDYAATDGNSGGSVFRADVVWPDQVKDDRQRKSAVGNWPQSPAGRNAEKIE